MALTTDIFYKTMVELVELETGNKKLARQFENVALHDSNIEDIGAFGRAQIADILDKYMERLSEFSEALKSEY